PEPDAAELAGAVAELADSEADARLVLLDPLGRLHVARVADGHGGLVAGRGGPPRRVVQRWDAAARRGRAGRSGVEHVEVVRPHVVGRVGHCHRWVARRSCGSRRRGVIRRRSRHRLARHAPCDRLFGQRRRRRRRHDRTLPGRSAPGAER
ncbi:Os04g0600651, partial [Oryza sativa Japonica Group]